MYCTHLILVNATCNLLRKYWNPDFVYMKNGFKKNQAWNYNRSTAFVAPGLGLGDPLQKFPIDFQCKCAF